MSTSATIRAPATPVAIMQCRSGCGACCIAPSITSPIPGMPQGKPAGVRCVQLSEDNRCQLFGRAERPAFCSRLQASHEMCGDSNDDAFAHLTHLEVLTLPCPPRCMTNVIPPR